MKIRASSLYQTCDALKTSSDCYSSRNPSCTWISGISYPIKSNGCRPFNFDIPGILSDAGVPTAQASTWYYTYHEHGTSVETQLCLFYTDASTCNARLECKWESDDSECLLADTYQTTETASVCPKQKISTRLRRKSFRKRLLHCTLSILRRRVLRAVKPTIT